MRYYQELGLLHAAGSGAGGSRRYPARDVARLRRILELRNVMGSALERIASILAAEDASTSAAQFHRGVSPERHKKVVVEPLAINRGMRARSRRIADLGSFLDHLEPKAERYPEVGRTLGVTVATRNRRRGRAAAAGTARALTRAVHRGSSRRPAEPRPRR